MIFHGNEQPPWQVSTYHLTKALIHLQPLAPNIGENFGFLSEYISQVVATLLEESESEDLGKKIACMFSLQGFLKATADVASELDASISLNILKSLGEIFHFEVFTKLEAVVSAARSESAQAKHCNDLWLFFFNKFADTENEPGSILLNCLFSNLAVEICKQATTDAPHVSETLLDLVMDRALKDDLSEQEGELIVYATSLANTLIENLDESADYIQLGSPQKILTAFDVKASAIELLGVSLYYKKFSAEKAAAIVESSLNSPSSLYSHIVIPVFKLGSYLSFKSENAVINIVKSYPFVVSSPLMRGDVVVRSSAALVSGLKTRPQDTVISLIYTLANMLTSNGSSGSVTVGPRRQRTLMQMDQLSIGTGSGVHTPKSIVSNGNQTKSGMQQNGSAESHSELQDITVRNIIAGLVTITAKYDDQQIGALTTTVLLQKIGKINSLIDKEAILGLADLAPNLYEPEFRAVIKALSSIESSALRRGEGNLLQVIREGRCRISRSFTVSHPFYSIYLSELLLAIVSKGDVQKLEHHRSHKEISAVAEEIELLLQPLAELLPQAPEKPLVVEDWSTLSFFRDAWFNMVVHGFASNSALTKKHYKELYVIARSTPPLVSETSANKVESELELNTVLRRGSSNSNLNNQRELLSQTLSVHNMEIKSISYPKVMFLAAANLLESIRADSGDLYKVLLYFGDPTFQKGDSVKYMATICSQVTRKYVTNVLKGGKEEFATRAVARQLRRILILCCHRVRTIQDVAFSCADTLIKSIPSSLCRPDSVYSLLDILTLLWVSILDSETDEYEPRSTFVSSNTHVKLELSDSYIHRKQTLEKLLEKARSWLHLTMASMAYDLKSLLLGYLASSNEYYPMDHIALGATVALEFGGAVGKAGAQYGNTSSTTQADSSAGFLSQYIWRVREDIHIGMDETAIEADEFNRSRNLLQKLASGEETTYVPVSQMRDALFSVCRRLTNDVSSSEIAQLSVTVPFRHFNERNIQLGVSLWLWIANEHPKLKEPLLAEVAYQWEKTVIERKGLFSLKYDRPGPEFSTMEYAPSNKAEIDAEATAVMRNFAPHLELIRFLSSFFESSMYDSKHILSIFIRMAKVGLQGLEFASLHPTTRLVRFELVKFGLNVLEAVEKFHDSVASNLKRIVMKSALTWFNHSAQWPFGGNKLRLRQSIALLKEVAVKIRKIDVGKEDPTLVSYREMLLVFLNDELSSMSAWLDPLQNNNTYKDNFGKKVLHLSAGITSKEIDMAWKIDPTLAVYLTERHSQDRKSVKYLEKLVSREPLKVCHVAESLNYFLADYFSTTDKIMILFWHRVSPIESVNLFGQQYNGESFVVQFAMRSLESHDANSTFFYVPQIVQSLRGDDKYGFVKRYILQTAKISQLFAHQIIWNILANSYRDEDSKVPDPMKPALDEVLDKMISSFDSEEKSFYDREFGFFNTVTSISGKLKPYIKKSKGEKKAKIDEEMDKIKVDVGVYLPSNPDGTVIDIDRRSGKPLQSHAKAPFLAKFKIRRDVKDFGKNDSDSENDGEVRKKTVDVWQGAIFKVGDDCRQDMLALQIISVFRSIFNASGLDLYVFPYRVTATAPGCGVIDVLPNSISRDMLGREAVNGLYEYFTSKFGGEDSIAFQRARNNFVKSLAAYSVISYLIQFKDRHNGNIMYDSDGHILHIDFGFCFDIVPGGVKFEAAPFKLTREMIAVMGGSTDTQAYKWFEELSIKAFLASRPYCELIVQLVAPMLDSGLPCFKGEKTIRNLRNRFALDKNEKDAALHFKSLIKKSADSVYTKGYDEFQRITNGIPY